MAATSSPVFPVTRRRRLFQRDEDELDEKVESCAKRKKLPSPLNIPTSKITKQGSVSTPSPVTPSSAFSPVFPCQRTTLSRAWENHELPCREEEISSINDFLRGTLVAGKSGCLYISGVPGTGKTACVNAVLTAMKEAQRAHILKINAFQYSQQPSRIYNVLAERLLPKTKSTMSSACCSQLTDFVAKSSKPIVLVLDEIDQLATKDSGVLYQIFEWALRPTSKLVLLAIANTLSFTSNELKRLQLKGCEPEQLYFAPYTSKQLATILKSRVEAACAGDVTMSAEAIELCARRIAAVTGDVRKALDVCRHAVEQISTPTTPGGRNRKSSLTGSPGSATKQGKMFFQGAGGLVGELPATPRRVTVGQVSRVLCQLYGARLKSTSGSTSGSTSTSSAPAADAPEDNAVPLKQKVLLCTMLLLKKSKNSVVTVSQLEDAFRFVCKQRSMECEDDVLSLSESLDNQGLVVTKRNQKNPRLSKIVLQFSDSEVEQYMSDKAMLSTISSLTLPKKR
ncbi:cell division control protein 6 homolog [Sycon ciliatum]|uniref:cell division control protein 6 homolog n=1 Tax=Sycon ciliatum TaxID=27933 RepID=UPI0031F6BDA6